MDSRRGPGLPCSRRPLKNSVGTRLRPRRKHGSSRSSRRSGRSWNSARESLPPPTSANRRGGRDGARPSLILDLSPASFRRRSRHSSKIIERARAVSERIGSLRDAASATRRDIAAFERTAQELAQPLARDLEGTAAEEVVLEIERRLAEAERIRQLRSVKEVEVGALDVRIEERRQALVRAATSVAHLMHATRVDSHQEIKKAIDRSDRRRALEAERDTTIEKLREDGDGLAIEELESQCMGADLDVAAATEAEIQAKLEGLQSRIAGAAEERSRARDAFEALGGSDAAARAAADREDALADLRGIAARYVRARGSALLLEWMIDRYRRERQAPLLERASKHLATLTAHSFTGLRVDYDDRDRPCLVGLRPAGGAVPVAGLSAGSMDQLYPRATRGRGRGVSRQGACASLHCGRFACSLRR